MILSKFVHKFPPICVSNFFIVETICFCSSWVADDVEILASCILKANALLTNLISSLVLSKASVQFELSTSSTLISKSEWQFFYS